MCNPEEVCGEQDGENSPTASAAGRDENPGRAPCARLSSGQALGCSFFPCGQRALADPHGIAVASDGTIYVADTKNNRIRSISNGTVKTLAGSEMGFADGKGATAMFTWPMGITLTTRGTILVADTWNYRIREVRPDGTVRTWAGTGERGLDNGPGAKATLMSRCGWRRSPAGTRSSSSRRAG